MTMKRVESSDGARPKGTRKFTPLATAAMVVRIEIEITAILTAAPVRCLLIALPSLWKIVAGALASATTASSVIVFDNGDSRFVGCPVWLAESMGGQRAVTNSAAVEYRSAGVRARAFDNSLSIHGGRSRRIAIALGGASVKRLTNPSFPAKGGRPVSISKRTQPRLYISLRPSSSRSPINCSGLM